MILASSKELENGQAYQAYQNYIESIKKDLTESVYAFATAPWHYNFSDPKCLHDSWVEQVTINEEFLGQRREIRSLKIRLELLGAFHDRIIFIEYSGVSGYLLSASDEKGHGDVEVDEIGFIQKGVIEHSIKFSNGIIWSIRFRDIKISYKTVEAAENRGNQ